MVGLPASSNFGLGMLSGCLRNLKVCEAVFLNISDFEISTSGDLILCTFQVATLFRDALFGRETTWKTLFLKFLNIILSWHDEELVVIL